MKNLAILGSTGSIGRSALDVVRAHPDKLRVVGLAAGANAEKLIEQATEFQPTVIAMATEDALQSVEAGYQAENGFAGADGLVAVATHPDVDIVICASSGTAGLEAVLAAIDAGKTIALANKEVLVMAGALVTAAARNRGVSILPVDSEHNAIHQCLHGRRRVRSIGPRHGPQRFVGRHPDHGGSKFGGLFEKAICVGPCREPDDAQLVRMRAHDIERALPDRAG